MTGSKLLRDKNKAAFKLRGLPTSILIDKDGREFGRVIGEVDFVSDDFLNLMEKFI